MRRRDVVKRSVVLARHKTSLSVEDEFWTALGELADRKGRSRADLIVQIDRERGAGSNLSSAVRLFVLAEVRKRAA